MFLDLKIAIIRSGLTQREVSLRARIPETRLSQIIRRRVKATPDERNRLGLILNRPPEQLFGSAPLEAA
jgi:hypothetical protein